MKSSVLQLLRSCGGFALARALSANKARILMYHNFSADSGVASGAVDSSALRGQLAYLRRNFKVIPLSDLLERLKSRRGLQKYTAAITVDDGRRNFYEYFYPLAKEFEIPVTFFVVSSFIRGEDWLWTDKVLWLAERRSRPDDLAPNKIDHFFSVLNRLRPEVREARISALAVSMSVQIPTQAPAEYAACSWQELREMADSELIDIGSHTVSHPILSSITEEESWRELTDSRAQIEEGIGKEVRLFCFPNGKPGDYRSSQVQQVADAGYAGAVLAHFGLVAAGAERYELPRLGVSGYSDALSFYKNVDGVEHYQQKLLKPVYG